MQNESIIYLYLLLKTYVGCPKLVLLSPFHQLNKVLVFNLVVTTGTDTAYFTPLQRESTQRKYF